MCFGVPADLGVLGLEVGGAVKESEPIGEVGLEVSTGPIKYNKLFDTLTTLMFHFPKNCYPPMEVLTNSLEKPHKISTKIPLIMIQSRV